MEKELFKKSLQGCDFTIVTPVYNGEAWIEETVVSVLNVCAGFNYQYIVVNDGSTDDTLEILLRYKALIQIESQSNQGEAAAVNKGLNLGNGKYAIIVSADDPMRSSRLLTESKKLFEQDKSLVCVYPDWSVIDSNSKIVRNVIVPEFSIEVLVGMAHCIVGPGGVFRRDIALQIGGRDSKYRFTSDYDFWLRLSTKGHFRRIPDFLAYWREHDNSTSIALRGREMANERIVVTRNFLKGNPAISSRIKKMATAYSYFNAAILVFFDPKIPAKRWLFKSLTNFPRGVFRFEPKVLFYILLNPLSPYILATLNYLGLFRKPSRNG